MKPFSFSYMIKKVSNKHLNILRTKRVFNMKQKAFFVNFKGLSLQCKQIKTIILVGENPTLMNTVNMNHAMNY